MDRQAAGGSQLNPSAPTPPPAGFAASKQLLTLPRLAWATATTLGVLWATLPAAQVAAVCATVLSITAASAYYSSSVLGGVVGDYLGATIAICELAIYLVLAADWEAAAQTWQPLALLAVVAALPVIYTRRIITLGGGGPTC